jgi:nucleosome binding factor SPN SPT16 subunit
MSQRLMQYFSDQMSDIIESDKKVTHEKLAEQIEGKLEDGAFWVKFKPTDGVSPKTSTQCHVYELQAEHLLHFCL